MSIRFSRMIGLLSCFLFSPAFAQELEIEKGDPSEGLAEAHGHFKKWQGGAATAEEQAEARALTAEAVATVVSEGPTTAADGPGGYLS